MNCIMKEIDYLRPRAAAFIQAVESLIDIPPVL